MAEWIRLERHVLASPATAYDTAWSTYGVSPGARSRSGRLEEEVPWGTHVTRAADPPRLSGPAASVLDRSNLDRLGQAFLPLDGWLGHSMWGAIGNGDAGLERRVLTHTLLLTEDAFRRIEGHPEGLLREDGAPAGWLRELTEGADFVEPRALESVRVTVDREARAALARSRLDELARLRREVLGALGGDPGRLRTTLSAMYEALARSMGGGREAAGSGEAAGTAQVPARRVRHVVVRGVGASTSTLLRLVWLSLPLEDRLAVSFVTEQRRTERPRARLLGLPEAEWGRYVPDGSWVLGEDEPFDAAPGRAHWADVVADPRFPEGFRRLDALARGRRWRLVGAGDLDAEAGREGWRREWRRDGATVEGVRGLWRVEHGRTGGPRTRAVGAALGRAVARSAGAGSGERALDEAVALLPELPAGRRSTVLRGAVRELRRRGTEGRRSAALLRCRTAATGDESAGEDLARLVDRESDALRTLLAEPDGSGGLELVLGAAPAAMRGDAVGRELARLGAAETRWTDRRAGLLVEGIPGDGDGAALLADLLGTVVAEGRAAAPVDALARAVAPRLDGAGLRGLAEELTGPRGEEDTAARGAVAFRILPAFAAVAGSGDDRTGAALMERAAAARPPGEEPDAWKRLVSDAPAAWLGRPAVLEAFLDVLAAGRRSRNAGAPQDGAAEVAGHLARRLLSRAGPGGLGDERAEAVLRLLWRAGSGDALEVLRGRPEAELAVLVELLVRPAPVPLFHRIRRRLVSRLDETPAGARPLDVPDPRLAAYAPAVAARLTPPRRGRRVFVARGR